MSRMRFGIFMAPFHKPEGNPTRALRRDIELLEHLDRLGFDEAWIGEHHSGGSELIGSPEVLIAAAAERTERIRLGTGVSSIPYHHPFLLAERLTMLDHLTRGRVMLGVGPGALVSDAWMFGIDPLDQRRMMAEGLDAIMHLLRSEEPLTVETDWFTLRDAALQIRPFSEPHFHVAVASVASPAGAQLAGRLGVGMLSVGATTDVGFDALAQHWDVVVAESKRAGHVPDRGSWRLVGPMHLAGTREQAIADVRYGLDHWVDYFQQTAAFPQLAVAGDTFQERVDFVNTSGIGTIGTVEDAIEQIQRLERQSGGFGCYLMLAHEWASPDATLRSFDLFSRYVMPEIQRTNVATRAAETHARSIRAGLFTRQQQAVDEATQRYEEEKAARSGG